MRWASVLAALAERGGGLAYAVAQEVQLGAPDLTVPNDLDPLDPRAVDLERALDADARCDPAHGDRGRDAAVAHPHHEALEHLDALAVALDDLGGDLHGVAGRDLGKVGAQLVLDDLVEHVHGGILVRSGSRSGGGGLGFPALAGSGAADGGG